MVGGEHSAEIVEYVRSEEIGTSVDSTTDKSARFFNIVQYLFQGQDWRQEIHSKMMETIIYSLSLSLCPPSPHKSSSAYLVCCCIFSNASIIKRLSFICLKKKITHLKVWWFDPKCTFQKYCRILISWYGMVSSYVHMCRRYSDGFLIWR